jgi:hypothetical protein
MTGPLPRWAKNQRDSEFVRRVQAERMTGKDQEYSKAFLLTTALDHAWRWYDLRINSGLQILNFYLLAMTVLTAAYVSAFTSRNHVISVAVALAGAAVSASSYMAGYDRTMWPCLLSKKPRIAWRLHWELIHFG